MRVTMPPAIALSAVLILPVACGTADEKPAAEDKSSVRTASTPTAPPATAELTTATFAPRVLAALRAKGTFRVETFLLETGSWDPEVKVDTTVRMKGAVTDLAVVDDGTQLVRVGSSLYLQAPELTGSTKRPWAKVNRKSKDADERAIAEAAELVLSRALAYEMIAATAHSTGIKRGGHLTIDRVDSQEYFFTIDLRKAVAANALRDLVDQNDLKTMAKTLSVSIAVDDKDLPRRIEFVLANTYGGASSVRAIVGGFGQRVTIAAPPAAKLAKLS